MTTKRITPKNLSETRAAWLAAWPEALALWSRFTRLREPIVCENDQEGKKEGLVDSFAMIRFFDQRIVIHLREIIAKNLEPFSLEILGHEIGHHVYCPADLADHGRMIARMRRALPGKERLVGLVANLYSDLMINNRLQRGNNMQFPKIYEILGGANGDEAWAFYLRVYEVLWNLPKGKLCGINPEKPMELDAQLGARVIRTYSTDWLKGAGRFAALILPYLIKGEENKIVIRAGGWLDTRNTPDRGSGDEVPEGLIDIDDDEIDGARHPALDEAISGVSNDADGGGDDDAVGEGKQPDDTPKLKSGGQRREPFEFGEILKELGFKLTPEELAIRYYRERALPYLIKFPVRENPQALDPLIESLETWDVGGPIEELDVFESAMVSPRIIPGVTTVRRMMGVSPGSNPSKEPIDLDLYIDCSGSMPDPRHSISFLALAGTIITLSALRVGSRVKATLWSGKHDFKTTGEFIRDEKPLLAIITGYIGGATAFPIHLLRETFRERTTSDRAVHILVISDDGVDTMFEKDEKNNSGWDIAAMALKNGRSGGTFVLNLFSDINSNPTLKKAQVQGWDVFRVKEWADLVAFARAFSQAKYGKKKT